MTQTLKQRRRQKYTRKQKGGQRHLSDFLNFNVPLQKTAERFQQNAKRLFSKIRARFTGKNSNGAFTHGSTNTPLLTSGGTRKRKQRKN